MKPGANQTSAARHKISATARVCLEAPDQTVRHTKHDFAIRKSRRLLQLNFETIQFVLAPAGHTATSRKPIRPAPQGRVRCFCFAIFRRKFVQPAVCKARCAAFQPNLLRVNPTPSLWKIARHYLHHLIQSETFQYLDLMISD